MGKSRMSEVARIAISHLTITPRIERGYLYGLIIQDYNDAYNINLTNLQINDSIHQLKHQMVIALFESKYYEILDHSAAVAIESEVVKFKWKEVPNIREYLHQRVKLGCLSLTEVASHLKQYRVNYTPKPKPKEGIRINKILLCSKYIMEFLGRPGNKTRFHACSSIIQHLKFRLSNEYPDMQLTDSTPYNSIKKLLSYEYVYRKKQTGNRTFYKFNSKNVKNLNAIFKNTEIIVTENITQEVKKVKEVKDIKKVDPVEIKIVMFQEITHIMLQIFLTEADDAHVTLDYLTKTVESIWKDKFPDHDGLAYSNINGAYNQLVIQEIVTLKNDNPKVFKLINRDLADLILNKQVKYKTNRSKRLSDMKFDFDYSDNIDELEFPDNKKNTPDDYTYNQDITPNAPVKVAAPEPVNDNSILDDVEITPYVVGDAILSVINQKDMKIDRMETIINNLTSKINSKEYNLSEKVNELTEALSVKIKQNRDDKTEFDKVIDENKKSAKERIISLNKDLKQADEANDRLLKLNTQLKVELKEEKSKKNSHTAKKFSSFKDLRKHIN